MGKGLANTLRSRSERRAPCPRGCTVLPCPVSLSATSAFPEGVIMRAGVEVWARGSPKGSFPGSLAHPWSIGGTQGQGRLAQTYLTGSLLRSRGLHLCFLGRVWEPQRGHNGCLWWLAGSGGDSHQSHLWRWHAYVLSSIPLLLPTRIFFIT